jgi:hypothetical protein
MAWCFGASFLTYIHERRFFDYDCVAPLEQPFAAVVYFMVFTAFASFVVLSLFVGTITLGMIEAMGLLSEIEETTEAHAIHRSRSCFPLVTEFVLIYKI